MSTTLRYPRTPGQMPEAGDILARLTSSDHREALMHAGHRQEEAAHGTA